MDIGGSRVLILGGSGLVGLAIARQVLPLAPRALILSGLTRPEAEAAVQELASEPAAEGVELIAEWGDIFLPDALKERPRAELLADAEARAILLDDLYGAPTPDAVERSALGAMLLRQQPDVVVDCINTATVFAYQNVFASASRMLQQARSGELDAPAVEGHLATLYLPQLIRHVQIALEALTRVGTKAYLKIGTAGTGGMGLNIPFTHSEERPSKMLLAKSSVAGAHTLLLYLMARTPGAPAVKEIKPTAAISWKRIGSGEVRRRGRPIARVDATQPLPLAQAFGAEASAAWAETGESLRGVYLDAGENGFFSPAEFEALTALGLMEFITPEEIATNVVRELRGFPTGRDVVAALDASTSGPTYRAGVLRHQALQRMDELERELEIESVAYEMLGPPRLAKLLFEAALLGRICDGQLSAAARLDAEQAAAAAEKVIRGDADLRTRILSIGLPILLPSGEEMLRGAELRVPPVPGEAIDVERLAERGWVDLRPQNWAHWAERARRMLAARERSTGAEGGSRPELEAHQVGTRIRPGALAAWIFRYEDRGERVKR
jgi:NAD(P)-dependent dehydrogenase (short-subunit alcohol dehydrogenase family)